METIKTTEEARALPEKESYCVVERADGVKEARFRDLVAVELTDETILWFVDLDGRLMTVNYDSEGAYKTPI